MGLYVSILVSTLSLVITWCVVRTMQRMRKRKSFGKRLLVVRDITSSLDLFWGIVFLVPLLRIPLLVIAGNSDFNMLIVVYMWMFYLPILSIINFTQAFSKVEVYQKGILSRNDIWQWNISELNSLKEDEKTTTYVFKLNRKIFKSDKVIILKRDKEKFDQAMYEVYQAIYK